MLQTMCLVDLLRGGESKCEPSATSCKMVSKRAQLLILMSCDLNLCTEEVKLGVNHLCSCSSVWGSSIAFSLVQIKPQEPSSLGSQSKI